MNKKKVSIISLALVIIIVFLTFAFLNGSFSDKSYKNIWTRSYLDGLETTQEKLIAHGIKASSSHNLQPWLVKIVNEEKIELYADMTKELKVVDQEHKQLLISHGTFIENYAQMAGAYGYSADVELHEADFKSETPFIASIILNKTDEKVDTISGSSFSPSGDEKDLELLNQSLAALAYDDLGLEFELVENAFDVKELQEWLVAGVEIESTHQGAMEELLEVFRWTEYDKSKFRYGLTLNKFSGFVAMFVQPIMKYTAVSWEDFGQQGISEFDNRVKNEFAYIFIRSTDDSDEAYIQVGRAYQRLITSGTGLTIRPNIQLLESYGDLDAYGQQFQETYKNNNGKIVMILGVQMPSNNALGVTPRHLVDDILIE